MLPAEGTSVVVCANHDKGGAVRKICTVGCISCSRCVKACPNEAISMEDSLAIINPEKCTNCGSCIEICPQNCIIELSIKEKVS